MKKFYFALIVMIGLGVHAGAQKVSGTIRGILQDSASATPLSDATVSIVRLKDSSLISFTITNASGAFEIKNIEAGTYNLVSSFQGLQTRKTKFTISTETPAIDLGIVQLSRYYKTMDAVVITEEAPVKVKGDTLSYTADAFKTKPNATVEDLLKKLPGVQVDRDGTVKAQGENVQKVYVDGKEFFGSDPKLATKNLTADMIDQVEVFDDMSEQAKFNKIDDGSRSKAINLKLKKDKKKGTFGKAYAGMGTEDRYDAGLNANFFKGATQTSVIAKANNINNVSFSVSDMLGMFGVGALKVGNGDFNSGAGVRLGGMGSNFSGGMTGLNLGATGSGLTSTSQFGINYRDTWSRHFDVNGSYFYNQAQTKNFRKSFKQSFYQDSTGLTDERVISKNTNDNHRFNMNMIYTIDSFNSIVYTPSFSTQNSQSSSDDTLMTSVQKPGANYHANESRNVTNSTGDGFNWNNNLIWRRRFRKAGRTLSVNASNTWNKSDRDKFSTINSRFFNQGGVKWFEGITNNLNTTESETRNYSVGFSYTEPLARDKMLELNYSHSDNRSLSDRKTIDYDPASGDYTKLVDTLSNNFQNQNLYDRFGGNFRVVKKKYNYQLGLSVQQTTLESENVTRKTDIRQHYLNLFPTASFNYQFQRSRSLRMSYRGRTSQPTISQLQDITDVSGYPNLYRGNPRLRQEFSNNFMLSYNFFDIVKFRNLFAFVTFSNTLNKIANATQDLGGGVQLTTPVNVNGVYALNGTFNFGLPIKHLKGGNFNMNTRINYNRDANLINKVKNYTKNLNIGEDLRLNYNYKEKLDLGITASVNYNSVEYTVQTRNNSSYFTHSYSADATYTFPKGFILSSDFDYTFNTGRTDGYNQNYAMWNGGLAKQVLKNKRGEIKASVFDILDQNTNVTRNIGSNYIEDVENSTLQRFFMLTFTYHINRMGGKKMPGMNDRTGRGMRLNF